MFRSDAAPVLDERLASSEKRQPRRLHYRLRLVLWMLVLLAAVPVLFSAGDDGSDATINSQVTTEASHASSPRALSVPRGYGDVGGASPMRDGGAVRGLIADSGPPAPPPSRASRAADPDAISHPLILLPPYAPSRPCRRAYDRQGSSTFTHCGVPSSFSCCRSHGGQSCYYTAEASSCHSIKVHQHYGRPQHCCNSTAGQAQHSCHSTAHHCRHGNAQHCSAPLPRQCGTTAPLIALMYALSSPPGR